MSFNNDGDNLDPNTNQVIPGKWQFPNGLTLSSEPVADTDAANKLYVDTHGGGGGGITQIDGSLPIWTSGTGDTRVVGIYLGFTPVINITANTTDGNPLTLFNFGMGEVVHSIASIQAQVRAFRTGGSAGNVGDIAVYRRTFCLKSDTAVATAGTFNADYTYQEDTQWGGVSLDITGNIGRFNVTGRTDVNITWEAEYFYQLSQYSL